MIGKIKTLGMTLAAVLVLASVAAAAAQAGELELGAQPATITAHNEVGLEHVFGIETKKKEVLASTCATATYEGTTQGQKINELTLTATYGTGKGNPAEIQNCILGGLKEQVLLNGCKYTVTGAGQAASTFLVDITGCTEGKGIEFKTAICTVDVPEQNGLSHLIGKQLSAQEATFETTLNKIKTLQTGAGCPDGNNFEGVNGALVGNTIFTAYKDAGTKQVTLHQHQYTEHLCGTQVSLTVK